MKSLELLAVEQNQSVFYTAFRLTNHHWLRLLNVLHVSFIAFVVYNKRMLGRFFFYENGVLLISSVTDAKSIWCPISCSQREQITAKFVVSRCAYCKIRRDFGFFCSVNHFTEGGVNANHNVTRSPSLAENDSY